MHIEPRNRSHFLNLPDWCIYNAISRLQHCRVCQSHVTLCVQLGFYCTHSVFVNLLFTITWLIWIRQCLRNSEHLHGKQIVSDNSVEYQALDGKPCKRSCRKLSDRACQLNERVQNVSINFFWLLNWFWPKTAFLWVLIGVTWSITHLFILYLHYFDIYWRKFNFIFNCCWK